MLHWQGALVVPISERTNIQFLKPKLLLLIKFKHHKNMIKPIWQLQAQVLQFPLRNQTRTKREHGTIRIEPLVRFRCRVPISWEFVCFAWWLLLGICLLPKIWWEIRNRLHQYKLKGCIGTVDLNFFVFSIVFVSCSKYEYAFYWLIWCVPTGFVLLME
jgi:hypothetical protein